MKDDSLLSPTPTPDRQEERMNELALTHALAAAFNRSSRTGKHLVELAKNLLAWPADLSIVSTHPSYRNSEIDARETDILVKLQAGKERYWVLIEVKINAPFGESQVEDYCKRRHHIVESLKLCDACCTLLIAPQRYLDSHGRERQMFDIALSLEDIRASVQHAGDDSSFVLILDKALEVFEAGHIPLIDGMRESQIEWYCSFVESYAPQVQPRQKQGKKQARDIFYGVPSQPRGYITHRIFAGEVFAGFMQRANMLPVVNAWLQERHDNSVTAEIRGGSLYIIERTIEVPALIEHIGFAEQEHAVQAGVDAVVRLHRWCEENASLVTRIVSQQR